MGGSENGNDNSNNCNDNCNNGNDNNCTAGGDADRYAGGNPVLHVGLLLRLASGSSWIRGGRGARSSGRPRR